MLYAHPYVQVLQKGHPDSGLCDAADILHRVKLEVCPCICFQQAGTRIFLLSVVRYGTTELADKVLSLCV